MDTFGSPQGSPEVTQAQETQTQTNNTHPSRNLLWYICGFLVIGAIAVLVYWYFLPLGKNWSAKVDKSVNGNSAQTDKKPAAFTSDQMQNFFVTRDGKVDFPEIDTQEVVAIAQLPTDVSPLLDGQASKYHNFKLGYKNGGGGFLVIYQDSNTKDFAKIFSDFYAKTQNLGWKNLIAQRTENFAFMDLQKNEMQMRVGYKIDGNIINISIQTIENAK